MHTDNIPNVIVGACICTPMYVTLTISILRMLGSSIVKVSMINMQV